MEGGAARGGGGGQLAQLQAAEGGEGLRGHLDRAEVAADDAAGVAEQGGVHAAVDQEAAHAVGVRGDEAARRGLDGGGEVGGGQLQEDVADDEVVPGREQAHAQRRVVVELREQDLGQVAVGEAVVAAAGRQQGLGPPLVHQVGHEARLGGAAGHADGAVGEHGAGGVREGGPHEGRGQQHAEAAAGAAGEDHLGG
ncbi:MAG: hypothetical protein ACK559_29330, partial [bacterium]